MIRTLHTTLTILLQSATYHSPALCEAIQVGVAWVYGYRVKPPTMVKNVHVPR